MIKLLQHLEGIDEDGVDVDDDSSCESYAVSKSTRAPRPSKEGQNLCVKKPVERVYTYLVRLIRSHSFGN